MATDDQIRALADSLGLLSSTTTPLSGALRDMLEGLVLVNNANQAAANSTLRNTNARSVELELLQKREEKEKAIQTAMTSFGSSLIRGINGLGSFSAQIYATTTAFESSRITLDTFSDIFKTVTQLIKDGLGPFEKMFGAGGVLKTLADAGLDLAINALKNRIEQARIITDTFQNVGKAGATFGGSLTELFNAAKESGLGLQEFGRFVSNNLQNLVGLGKTVSQSAVSITKLTEKVVEQDQALLAIAGSYGALSAQVAEYTALQRQAGIITRLDSAETSKAVKDYIRQQNILTEITGKGAAEQKRQEEERRKIAAYNIEISKLDPVARNNLQMGMGLLSNMAPELASVMTEFMANQGQLINEQSIQFATMFPEMFEMGKKIVGSINQPADQFEKSLGETSAAMAPAIRAQIDTMQQTGLLGLAASRVSNDIIQMLGRVSASFLPFEQNLRNLPDLLQTLRNQIQASNRPDDQSRTLSQAINTQRELQKELDKLAIENLKSLPTIIEATGKIATNLIKMEKEVSQVANALIGPAGQGGVLGTLNQFKDNMIKAMKEMFGDTGPAGNAPVNRQTLSQFTPEQISQRIQDLQKQSEEINARIKAAVDVSSAPGASIADQTLRDKFIGDMQQELFNLRMQIQRLDSERRTRPQAGGRQEGGIATEPMMVGENNQPEAVIPLARGSIPLNIDFNPMIRLMEQQRSFLEELLSASKDQTDYLERIYHATA